LPTASADLRGVETSAQNDAASLASRKLALAGSAALRLLADDEEIAQVGDDDEAVGLEVFGDLLRLGLQPGVVRDGLHLYHAALGHLPLPRRAALELAGGEQAEIRVSGTGILEIGETEHAPPQIGADGIQQAGESSIVGPLGRTGAQAVRIVQSREIVFNNPDELVSQDSPSPPQRGEYYQFGRRKDSCAAVRRSLRRPARAAGGRGTVPEPEAEDTCRGGACSRCQRARGRGRPRPLRWRGAGGARRGSQATGEL
jgi:hypothetical protein